MEIRKFSDAELVQALRCCRSAELGCEECPADFVFKGLFECASEVSQAAADRIERLSHRLDAATGMILRLDDERRQAGG